MICIYIHMYMYMYMYMYIHIVYIYIYIYIYIAYIHIYIVHYITILSNVILIIFMYYITKYCVCAYLFIYFFKCVNMHIYIYILYGTPPRPDLPLKQIYWYLQCFFLTVWALKLRACFGDLKLQIFASLFPSHPSQSTSDSRFKIQDPKKTSWIQVGRCFALNDEPNYPSKPIFTIHQTNVHTIHSKQQT